MKSTQKLALLLAVAVLASGGVAAQTASPLPAGNDDLQQWVTGYDVPSDQLTHGPTGNPQWIVTTSDAGALSSWANESSNREVVRSLDANRSVVAASPGELGLTLLADLRGSGLATASYVERISPNRDLTLADPVATGSIPTAENATAPTEWSGGLRGSLRGAYPDSGIAYRDSTNESTIGDVRRTVGSDNVSATGEGVTVAVIDTGVNHANGSIGIKDNLSPESKDFIDDATGVDAVKDPNGHGSWVTSAIAADPDSTVSDETHEGLAPNATILGLRVLDEDGSGTTADIAAAVRYAEAHDADVLAMSLGSQRFTPEVAAAIEDACAGNVTTVSIAAGNSRRNGSPYLASPADVPQGCVVSVAASNTSDPDTAGVASFSQLGSDPGTTDMSGGVTRGEDIDVAAPGMLVNATVARTDESQRYHTLSGTSMAQPVVAGGAAQLLDAHSALHNESDAVRQRLTATARRMPNAAEVEAGSGMLAVDRAIANNETERSQADAMDETAQTRNEFWSQAGSEGLGSRILNRLGV